MGISVSQQVVIAKSRRDVAQFMFDPQNDLVWTGGVVEVRPLQPGLLRPGAKVERVSKFLGRRMTYLIEVTAAEPESYVEMYTEQPFEMRVRYGLLDTGDGTAVEIRAGGGGTGFFKVAAPFLSRMVARSIQNDLLTLKEYLEAR